MPIGASSRNSYRGNKTMTLDIFLKLVIEIQWHTKQFTHVKAYGLTDFNTPADCASPTILEYFLTLKRRHTLLDCQLLIPLLPHPRQSLMYCLSL
jgi:hypothetical protein